MEFIGWMAFVNMKMGREGMVHNSRVVHFTHGVDMEDTKAGALSKGFDHDSNRHRLKSVEMVARHHHSMNMLHTR